MKERKKWNWNNPVTWKSVITLSAASVVGTLLMAIPILVDNVKEKHFDEVAEAKSKLEKETDCSIL